MRALVSMPRSPTKHTRASPNRVFELCDLGSQGFGVGGVALEHLDRDRHPGGRAQQPVDDLQPAFHPVAGVPDCPQRAGAAFKRRRGHVIQHQRSVGQMPCGQGVFDGLLAGQRPVHRRIQVILVAAATPSSWPSELVAVSVRSPRANASLEPGRDHLRHQHRAHQIALARRRRVDQLLDAQRPRGAQHRGHMPVRQAAGDLERLAQIPLRRQPFERARQRIDLVLGPVRQVGQGAVFHLAALAVALPQQDGRR